MDTLSPAQRISAARQQVRYFQSCKSAYTYCYLCKIHHQFNGITSAFGWGPSPGLELRELHGILQAHGLSVDLRVADDKLTDEQIRRELITNLATPDDYVVVNIFRPVLGQKGGGHLSPLGAYDRASDSFLLMDVNPNAQPWVWIPAPLLFRSMRTLDVNENRGYLLVREGTGPK